MKNEGTPCENVKLGRHTWQLSVIVTINLGTRSVPLWVDVLTIYPCLRYMEFTTGWIDGVVSLLSGSSTAWSQVGGRISNQKVRVEVVGVFCKARLVAKTSSAVRKFTLKAYRRIGTAARAQEGSRHGPGWRCLLHVQGWVEKWNMSTYMVRPDLRSRNCFQHTKRQQGWVANLHSLST